MAERSKPERYPLVEWLSAAVGLVVTTAMFGLLAVEAARQRHDEPPLLEVVPVQLVSALGRYVVEVEVSNASRTTGAGVHIEGTLKRGDSEVESSTVSVSYVPGQSSRRAGLVFTHDPRRYRLELRVTGYERP